MPEPNTPATVAVEALEDHTTDGIAHAKGEQYDAPEGAVPFLIARGYAKLVTAPD